MSKDTTELQASSEGQFKTDMSGDCPLCVDMDGTLLKTDSLLESILLILKINGFYLFMVCVWALRGKAVLKYELARRVIPDVLFLPYRPEFLSYLKDQRRAGRKLVLVTGAHLVIARRVADHLGLFDEVLATDGVVNLTGSAKLQALNGRFGESGYDYAGNEKADLIIWKHARQAIVVGASHGLRKRAQQLARVTKVIEPRRNVLWDVWRAIRPHQWVKNALLFVPLITSHQVADGRLELACAVGFIAFSFCASSVYLVNDLLDIESDRHHPSKRERPFASGNLSPWWGGVVCVILLGGGFGAALALPGMFMWLLGLYLMASTAYSFGLKKRAIVDVLVLAGLYTIRIYAGAEAIGAILTPWLLAFSGFVFLSLAFIKRSSELLALGGVGGNSVHGRGYSVGDAQFVLSVGPASGYMACLVLALYVSSPDVAKLYSRPGLLWLLCPVLLYWISRVWLICSRKEMHQDPIVFAARDRTSYVVAAIGGLIMFLAK